MLTHLAWHSFLIWRPPTTAQDGCGVKSLLCLPLSICLHKGARLSLSRPRSINMKASARAKILANLPSFCTDILYNPQLCVGKDQDSAGQKCKVRRPQTSPNLAQDCSLRAPNVNPIAATSPYVAVQITMQTIRESVIR